MRPGNICLLLLLLFLFGFTKTNAQLIIFGGPQATSANYSIRDAQQETEHKVGFMGGLGYKTLIEGNFYFSPMVFYSRKGYKVKFDRPAFPPDSGAVNNNTSINTIELAPLVQFNFSKKESYGYLRFGPSFDFNLSGTETFDSSHTKTITRSMKFDYGTYSHATISMNLQTGFQHKSGFTAYVFYNFGVSSFNNADYGPKIFHRVGGLALGWRLGKSQE